jgi:hypothetical protein
MNNFFCHSERGCHQLVKNLVLLHQKMNISDFSQAQNDKSKK